MFESVSLRSDNCDMGYRFQIVNFKTNIEFMKVYKFGGASVKDGSGIRNMAEIVSEVSDNLVIVVSAFGKTTNALEKVLKAWINKDENCT